ncbi:MAG TPA: flagellar export chaperone FliS [Methylovorus sp.]|jgi:flagellar secretion chaperone FliS|nr:flagellar export chaperone FliS [Methylovorus sp.]
MFGSSRGVNEYSRVGVETGVVSADPHKLVVMLYEGALTACHTAIMHMEAKEIERKGAMISKAIMIIESGLRLSLDKKAGGEIAASLDALYGYMSDRLYMANIKNDPSLIQEVIRLLGDLKSAWEAIGTQNAPDNAQFQRVQNYAKA